MINQNLILLPKDHQISKLFLHQYSHLGIAAAMAKFRLRFWICGSVRMMKTINYKFVICRKLDKFFASLRMASSPNKRLKPSCRGSIPLLIYLDHTLSKGKLTKDAKGKLMA